MSTRPDVSALLASLATTDTDQGRALRAALRRAAAEARAMPVLVDALEHGSPAERKAAAYLLRLHGRREEVRRALCAALSDPEPKVRRNAAVSLSRTTRAGTEDKDLAVQRLAAALERETVAWVRPSLILALGAIGGPTAHGLLRALETEERTPAEGEALRKALERSARPDAAGAATTRVGWRIEAALRLTLLLDVPVGFEAVAQEEASERGVNGLSMVGPGLLRCTEGTCPSDVFPALRCVYRLVVEGGHSPPIEFAAGNAASPTAEITAELVARSSVLRRTREWLDAPGDAIPFRLALGGRRVPRTTYRAVLEEVRSAAIAHGLVDSPSDYVLQLVVQLGPEATDLLISPSFMPDGRFAYRGRDAGASINPVMAACIARVVRVRSLRGHLLTEHTVFDPTCGSGTLLIERALLDPACRLIGLDVSPTAVAAARENIRAAGLQHRIRIERGDATDPRLWPACDEVLANLPFGLRTHRHDRSLEHLYSALTANLSHSLRPGGQAVLYTTQSYLLERTLRAAHLTPTSRIRTISGEMSVTVWCVHKRSEMVLG